MDIQNFINQNKEYLVQFKDLNLQYRKYNVLGLTLVKYKHDTDINDFTKLFKSVIIDQKTNKIVSIAPMKSVKSDHNILMNKDTEISRIYDGTMINVFFHNGEWNLSTRSFIGANNYWNKNSKKSFKDMFNECFHQYNELDQTHSYSFVLQHKDNSNIVPIKNNRVVLVEEYSYDKGYPERIDITRNSRTYQISNTYKNYHELKKVELDIHKYDKGFNIFKDGCRHVYITDDYKYIFDLKPNQNNKMFIFLTLYKQRKLNEYLTVYTDDRNLFDIYRNKYEIMRSELYSNYCKHFIEKSVEKKDVPYQLKPLIYELHDIYRSAGQKINYKLINDYLQNMNVKRLTFILNYY
tara:strand:- start:1185 stop:2237 length:1053 start_codon:yes stop_codon:yes gene_type:complete